MTNYVLLVGEYDRESIVMVKSDVKAIVKKYVELVEKMKYPSFDKPHIQIWNEDDEKYPTAYFSELNKNQKQIIKYLTKVARKI